jgi:hypothetical protein
VLVSQRENYVLQVACKLFKETYPYAKDKKGYSFPDAWLFKDLMERDASTLTQKNVEWVRRALLKYQEQIEKLGFDYWKIESDRISPIAAYWKKDMINATYLRVKVTSNDCFVRFEVIYRLFNQRQREKAFAEFPKKEGIAILKELVPQVCDYSFEGYDATLSLTGTESFFQKLCEKLGLPTLTVLENTSNREAKPE